MSAFETAIAAYISFPVHQTLSPTSVDAIILICSSHFSTLKAAIFVRERC